MFNQDQLNQFYRYCYNLTQDEASAYDLLQTALEKYLNSPRKKNNPQAFLYRIIRNQFIDQFRQQQHHPQEEFLESSYVDFDIQTLENLVIEEDLVASIMKTLPVIDREILFYWAMEGYTTQQVADILDMPKGSVLSRIYRMRQKIQTRFPEADDQNETEARS